MDTLPTIKQIIRQADWTGNEPMSDEESQEWFDRTCAENRQAINEKLQREGKS